MNELRNSDSRLSRGAGPSAMTRFTASILSCRAIVRPLGRRLLAGLVAAHVTLAVMGSSALAQPNTRPRPSNTGDGISLDLNGWIAETVMLFLAMGLAFAVMFLVVYPMLLRKTNPWWPLNAYGFCLAIAFTLCCAAALAIFWEDLVLRGTQPGGPVGTVEQYGLRGGFGAIWLVVSGIILSVFRSSKGRASTR